MQSANELQRWVVKADRRIYALVVGIAVGIIGGLIGLLIVVAEPLIAVGLIFGTLAGLFILTSVQAALYAMIAVMALLPFGTLPFRIGLTPTFLDAAMLAFLVVYLVQWMTGRRSRTIKLTPVHPFIGLYLGWLIFSFLLGLRYALPTSTIARQFAETLLSISLTFILVDLLRDVKTLRRLVLVFMLCVGAQALIAIILYVMPNDLAERTLVRLARFGYPNGGVIRFIEDVAENPERAIGTWIDPNSLGGFLVISALIAAPQVFARLPVLKWRWFTWVVLGVVVGALLLTFSRASALAFGVGIFFVGAFKGYRRFWALIVLGVVAILLLPQTQGYLTRFIQAFTAQDLATQMRIGEYGDAFELISQYPFTGIGFTGTPTAALYTDVASMYLIMANQIGLTGVAFFALLIVGVFVYGWRAWKVARNNDDVRAIHIGYHAALIGVLLNSTADLYFFRLDFHASITLLWLVIALCLTSSRLALERGDSLASQVNR